MHHGRRLSYSVHTLCYIQSNLNSSDTDGSFTLVFESLQNSYDISSKQIFTDIFLLYHEIVCCVYSLESSHGDDFNGYTQHTIVV